MGGVEINGKYVFPQNSLICAERVCDNLRSLREKQNIKDMTSKLFFQALTKFLAGLVLVGALLFVPAGTFAYWQGWLFIAGLYGIVRHPMYAATLVLFLAMPLVLASPWSFLIMLLYIPIIAKRIRNEEVVLEQGLEGYTEYKQKVRYKVIPFVW